MGKQPILQLGWKEIVTQWKIIRIIKYSQSDSEITVFHCESDKFCLIIFQLLGGGKCKGGNWEEESMKNVNIDLV